MNGIVFAGVQFAYAVMSLAGKDDGGRAAVCASPRIFSVILFRFACLHSAATVRFTAAEARFHFQIATWYQTASPLLRGSFFAVQHGLVRQRPLQACCRRAAKWTARIVLQATQITQQTT